MKEENLKVWNELKSVPKEAKKIITGGRLKGLTDIKPQWRLQMMTEQFGIIGFGWYYEIKNKWLEAYGSEISAHIELNLFIKGDEKWSAPIVGIGGSMLVANEKIYDNEKNLYDSHFKPYHSDEAYKMATTDALSVAMKQLGVAADVYMGLSDSKYDKHDENAPTPSQQSNTKPFNEYKKDEVKKMTGKQKGTLKDQVIVLDKLGTESTNAALLAVNAALKGNPTFDDAAHLINKVKLTIEKVNP